MSADKLVHRFVTKNLASPIRGLVKKYPDGVKRSPPKRSPPKRCIREGLNQSSEGETDFCSMTDTEDDSQCVASPGQGEKPA